MRCIAPFRYLEIFEDFSSICCPGWLYEEAYCSETDVDKAWNSETFKQIRQQMLDGNPKFCRPGACPWWGQDHRLGSRGRLDPPLEAVRISFDRTCNLYCISCRDKVEFSDPEKVQKQLDSVIACGKDIKQLEMCGAGDPIASPVYRNFLLNFPENSFPKLETIKLHTNAQLLTQVFYEKLPGFVKERFTNVEISIDAATKDTYERIRRGGNWETLIENLKFLKSTNKIRSWELDFVVQRLNYKEIKDFFKFAKEIAGQNCTTGYQWMQYWKWAVSEETFKANSLDFYPEEALKAVKMLKAVKAAGAIVNWMPDLYESLENVKKNNRLV